MNSMCLSMKGRGMAISESSNVNVLQSTAELKALHTIIRSKETSRSDFIFYSDRIIRLLVEESRDDWV